MFWAFKLSFDVDRYFGIFGPLFPKIRQNFIQFSGHTGRTLLLGTFISESFDLTLQ
jgi:hypothetical protein